MGKIVKLPESVVKKTAAGEVIESPASVVKELLENSLDAGASVIKISVENGGKSKIIVADDGVGMCKEDLLMAPLSHTSGKIRFVEDLEKIETFGFRGEALNSIAVVSRLKIKTKEASADAGWMVEVAFGDSKEESLSAKPCGMATGTVVEVANLFSNLSARRKFLKGASYELRKIADVVSAAGLANEKTAFFLYSGDRTVLSFPLQYDLQTRLRSLMNNDVEFLSLGGAKDHVSWKGLISTPQFSTSSSSGQYIFVNGRRISWRPAVSCIKKAYGTLLDKHSYPKFALFLNLPPELVDVNVHPRKEEVRIRNEEMVLELLQTVVKKTLAGRNLTYQYGAQGAFSHLKGLYTGLAESVEMWDPSMKESARGLKEVAQFARTYLLVPLKDRVLLIDQHAAHEKILYAQILACLKGEAKKQVNLKTPLKINLKEITGQLIDSSRLSNLESLGIEANIKNEVLWITQVPEILQKANIKKLVCYLLEFEPGEVSLEYSNDISHVISTLACKSAIKAGDFLTPRQRLRLVKKLFETRLAKYTCPHGRPSMIELHLRDFERMFKR